jgi:succinylglutamate desuccinylase
MYYLSRATIGVDVHADLLTAAEPLKAPCALLFAECCHPDQASMHQCIFLKNIEEDIKALSKLPYGDARFVLGSKTHPSLRAHVSQTEISGNR